MKRSCTLFLTIISMSILSVGCGEKDDLPVTIDRDDIYIVSTESSISQGYSDPTTEDKKTEESFKVTVEPYFSTSEEPVETTEELTESTEESTFEEVSISHVEDIINVLMSSTSQVDIDKYLDSIATDESFYFTTIVDKSTRVTIESIGVNNENPNEYLAIVTLRQDGGISKFSVVITFIDSKLSSFNFEKF